MADITVNSSQEYLLEMAGICKEFPGVKALDNVNLKIRPHSVHALMGENGALFPLCVGEYFHSAK